MSVLIGCFGIVWGLVLLYVALFRLKPANYRDKSPIGANGDLAMEVTVRLFGKVPNQVAKVFVMIVGILFIGFGIYFIL